jgi:hypothetical protein
VETKPDWALNRRLLLEPRPDYLVSSAYNSDGQTTVFTTTPLTEPLELLQDVQAITKSEGAHKCASCPAKHRPCPAEYPVHLCEDPPDGAGEECLSLVVGCSFGMSIWFSGCS